MLHEISLAQERYSSIERELLCVVFGLEWFHNLIFGGPLEIQTDHLLLVNIVSNRVCDVSPRLQQLLLRLHKYEVKMKYIRGSENKSGRCSEPCDSTATQIK